LGKALRRSEEALREGFSEGDANLITSIVGRKAA
jgi:hypothetical protein